VGSSKFTFRGGGKRNHESVGGGKRRNSLDEREGGRGRKAAKEKRGQALFLWRRTRWTEGCFCAVKKEKRGDGTYGISFQLQKGWVGHLESGGRTNTCNGGGQREGHGLVEGHQQTSRLFSRKEGKAWKKKKER